MRSLTAAASPTPTLASLAALSPDALKLLALSVPSIMYILYRMCEMDDVDAARCTQDARTSLESPVRHRRKSSTATSRRRSSGAAKATSPSRREMVDDSQAGEPSVTAGHVGTAEVAASLVKSPSSCSVEAIVTEQRRPFVSRHVKAAFARRTDSGLDVLTASPAPQSPVTASATIVGPSP